MKMTLQVKIPVADIKDEAHDKAGVLTQLLLGMRIEVLHEKQSWVWVKSDLDGYEGYMCKDDLAPLGEEATHYVFLQRAFVYRDHDLRLNRTLCLSMGSKVRVVDTAKTRDVTYAIISSGEAIAEKALKPVSEYTKDYIKIAESLIYTPYLWGGISSFGIDCSGLIQLSFLMTGRKVLRDSGQQYESIGKSIELSDIMRGDLVFWNGHVALMKDHENIIHANSHTMMVSEEPLQDIINRIGFPKGFRRPCV